MKRILTAAILIPILWVAIKMAPPPAFFVVAVIAIALAAWECYGLLETRGDRPFKRIGTLASLAIAWSFLGAVPEFDSRVPLLCVTAIALLLSMGRRPDAGSMLRDVASTLFPVLFVGLTLSCVVGLRALPGDDGEDLPMLLLVCVICSDTAAYYVGSTIGKHRMAPTLSPKKTWEGAAGGAVASVGGALVAHFWFYQRLALPHAIALGVLLAVAGTLGDLSESMVKRAAGAKDSSSILPGHGGMLDRVDSLLLAGPFLYYYYVLFLEGRM